jgi:nucleoside-diphosphate-sugar epimerase
MLRSKYNVKVTVYRPFSGYGEDQFPSYPFPSLVGQVVDKKLLDEEGAQVNISIWSNATRDFVYIEDIVSCVLATYPLGLQKPLNLATGRGTSMDELVKIIAQESGFRSIPRVDILSGKPEGVNYR